MPDESIPPSTQPLERRLATILCADVASYSKMMASNEERTVKVFRGHREIFESLVKMHRGRIFNTAGDALLAEFNSPVEAVRCATEIQAALRTRNEHLEPEEKMLFRMGVNLGDVIIQGGDLLGDGVNIAARIQTATAPGGICISGSVHDQIQNKLSLDFKLLGERTYKNIAKPVRTYTINEDTIVVTPSHRMGWRALAASAMAVLAITGASYWGYHQYDAIRTERHQAEARLTAQKQAIDQAQQAAEEAKREMQLQTQKLAAEEGLRRAEEERKRVEQDRKQIEAEKRAAMAAKQQITDETLHRAQVEKNQLEKERKRIDAEKKTADTDVTQATSSQRATLKATTQDVTKLAASHDGTYSGQLCNLFTFVGDKTPGCWPLALVVSNGIIEGNWISKSMKPAKAYGTVGNDGSVKLNLAAWTLNGLPARAVLLGRIVDGAITTSGKWRPGGGEVTGNWNRTP